MPCHRKYRIVVCNLFQFTASTILLSFGKRTQRTFFAINGNSNSIQQLCSRLLKFSADKKRIVTKLFYFFNDFRRCNRNQVMFSSSKYAYNNGFGKMRAGRKSNQQHISIQLLSFYDDLKKAITESMKFYIYKKIVRA